MSVKTLLDTNILVYALDGTDPAKRKTALGLVELLLDDPFYMVSTQVLGEFCSVVQRKLQPPPSLDQILVFIESIPGQSIIPTGKDTYAMALVCQSRKQFAFWDALIVSSAIQAGCGRLLSEDMQHGMIVEGVMIQNPFV